MGPILDRGSLATVHVEMGPAVAASRSTKILDSIPGTWSPGDEPGDPVKRKKSYYFQSTMFTKFLSGATLSRISELLTGIGGYFLESGCG